MYEEIFLPSSRSYAFELRSIHQQSPTLRTPVCNAKCSRGVVLSRFRVSLASQWLSQSSLLPQWLAVLVVELKEFHLCFSWPLMFENLFYLKFPICELSSLWRLHSQLCKYILRRWKQSKINYLIYTWVKRESNVNLLSSNNFSDEQRAFWQLSDAIVRLEFDSLDFPCDVGCRWSHSQAR